MPIDFGNAKCARGLGRGSLPRSKPPRPAGCGGRYNCAVCIVDVKQMACNRSIVIGSGCAHVQKLALSRSHLHVTTAYTSLFPASFLVIHATTTLGAALGASATLGAALGARHIITPRRVFVLSGATWIFDLISSGNELQPSRRRDCHSAAPPSTDSRCFNTDGEGMSA